MNSAIAIVSWKLAVLMVLMLALWVFSLIKHNVSIIDDFCGLGFVVVAWITLFRADGCLARSLVLLIMTTVSGLRLALRIGKRNWGKGEDRRYQAWRREHGKRFWWVSLFTVFGIQGILLWIISLVVQVGQFSPYPARLTWFDGLWVVIWGVGFGFEAVADLQLARFKAEPS